MFHETGPRDDVKGYHIYSFYRMQGVGNVQGWSAGE